MPDEIAAQNAPLPVLRARGHPKKAWDEGATPRFTGAYGTRAYWVARFRRDFPEVALLVEGGRMSANAAAIQLGWIKRRRRRKPRGTKFDAIAAMIG